MTQKFEKRGQSKMRLVTSVVIAATALAGCSSEDRGEKIKLGALLPTSGDLGGVGTAQLEGIALAVEHINASGGVLGKKLEIVHRDDATNPERAATAAAELVDAGVSAVIGSAGSGLALAGFEVFKGKSIVQIATSATSPSLTTVEDDGYLFRTCASDAARGVLVAQRARAKGFDKVAVLHMPGVYGEGLAAAFEASFVANGGTVTTKVQYVEGQSNYGDALASVFATSPQAVLLVAYPVDAATIISGYNSGYSTSNAFWFLTDGHADKGFLSVVGASGFNFAHEGMAEGSPEGATVDQFLSAFQARYGTSPQPGDYTANAYDAVHLAALSMVAGNGESGVIIRDNLASVSAEGKPFTASQYAEAVAALEAGEDIDYVGASGTVDLDAAGDTHGLHNVWKVEQSGVVIIEKNVEP